MGFFADNLLRFLPEFYEGEDGSGDLASLLQILAIPLDQVEDMVANFHTIFDVDECDPKYLPVLAKMLNYSLHDRDSVASQRLQLKFVVDWYKRKGMQESFSILFYSLGYAVKLVPLWTKDYKSFFRYPGTWNPPIFRASIRGSRLVMMDITPANRNLRLSIDGGAEVPIQLSLGSNRLLTAVAAEIDSVVARIGGSCSVVDEYLTLSSRVAGESSVVRVVDVDSSAYTLLGLSPKTVVGIDYTVPDDWPELLENGGDWYATPHFGVEARSLLDYVIDAGEFDYIKSRLELARPANTVLDAINYAKYLSETFRVTEDAFLGNVQPGIVEVWPFQVCMHRASGTPAYKRDGLVPRRRAAVTAGYMMVRNPDRNVIRRDAFTYEFLPLSRGNDQGPPQMPTRGVGYYYRGGYPSGGPTRKACSGSETLTMDVVADMVEEWTVRVRRDAGLRRRDTVFRRDGEFSRETTRSNGLFSRSGAHEGFTRSKGKRVLEGELQVLFTSPDLPGLYFPSIAAMSDPDVLGIESQLPGPGEQGPVLG